MAIKGLSATAIKKYVPKDDPCRGPKGEPVEGSTVFKLKSLNGFEKAIIKDTTLTVETVPDGKGGITIRVQEDQPLYRQSYETLRYGLLGWDNFLSPSGEEIKFETESVTIGGRKSNVPTWASLELIPNALAVEIMLEILSFNELTKDDESKSGAVSLPGKSTQSDDAPLAMPLAGPNGGVGQSPSLTIEGTAQESGLTPP